MLTLLVQNLAKYVFYRTMPLYVLHHQRSMLFTGSYLLVHNVLIYFQIYPQIYIIPIILLLIPSLLECVVTKDPLPPLCKYPVPSA